MAEEIYDEVMKHRESKKEAIDMGKIKVDQDSKTDDKEIFKKIHDSNKKIQEHIQELEKNMDKIMTMPLMSYPKN